MYLESTYYLLSSGEMPTMNGSLEDSWNCLLFLCSDLDLCGFEGCVWPNTTSVATAAVTLPPSIAANKKDDCSGVRLVTCDGIFGEKLSPIKQV